MFHTLLLPIIHFFILEVFEVKFYLRLVHRCCDEIKLLLLMCVSVPYIGILDGIYFSFGNGNGKSKMCQPPFQEVKKNWRWYYGKHSGAVFMKRGCLRPPNQQQRRLAQNSNALLIYSLRESHQRKISYFWSQGTLLRMKRNGEKTR